MMGMAKLLKHHGKPSCQNATPAFVKQWDIQQHDRKQSYSILHFIMTTFSLIVINNNTFVIYCSKLLARLSECSLDSKYIKGIWYLFLFRLFHYTQIKFHSQLEVSKLFKAWCLLFSLLQCWTSGGIIQLGPPGQGYA